MKYYIIKSVNDTPFIYAQFDDYEIAKKTYETCYLEGPYELVGRDQTEEISKLQKLIAKITTEREIAKYFRNLAEAKYRKVVNAFFNLKKRYDNRE